VGNIPLPSVIMYVRVFFKYFIFILLLTGCRSIDEKGRLEKIRVMIPAFMDIQFEYYKDKENKEKNSSSYSSTTPPPITNWPKLMPRSKNKN